jgi:hypothetical protein
LESFSNLSFPGPTTPPTKYPLYRPLFFTYMIIFYSK